MISKFSNLDEFFNFLELKRAEISRDFGIDSEISESIFEMTTAEERKDQSDKDKGVTIAVISNTGHYIGDDIGDEFSQPYSIKYSMESSNESSIESSIESELIQMAWSTSFETPQKATDTTIVMDQLNLNDSEFDCIDDDLLDIEKLQPSTVVDPLGLDSLTFPMSQFHLEFERNEVVVEEDKDFLDDLLDDYNEEELDNEDDDNIDNLNHFDNLDNLIDDEFDFEITMSQLPSTQAAIPTTSVKQQDFSVSFSTGRGVKLPPPSEASLRKAQSILEEQEETNEPIPIEVVVGFKTGRGKELPPPSKEAMKRARSLVEFDEKEENFDDGNVGEAQNAFPMFTTGKGKAMPPPSEEALKRAKTLIDTVGTDGTDRIDRIDGTVDIVNPISNSKSNKTNSSAPVGFSTGRGKALPPPSEEAIARANKLIEAPKKDPGLSTGAKKPLVPGNTAFKPPSLIKSESSSKPRPKPFSLSNAWKRPRRTISAAGPVETVKSEPVELFDLKKDGMQRFTLKEFFKSSPNLNISNYTSYHIPNDILRIDSKSAIEFKFPGKWGFPEAHQSLISNGAQINYISLSWTANHYRWIIWKFASLVRCFPEKYSIANLSPAWVLQQLLYRYEREIHQCHRSALKKIIERDDAAGKYLCLVVASIDRERRIIELSDGWYSIWTNQLDETFWELVEGKKKIFEGMKIEISGATLVGTQDGIPALEAASIDCQCRLVFGRNSCRPARWDTKLGFITSKHISFLKHLHQIHPQGGNIPALSLIIDRVYPLLFREETGDSRHARNERDHFLYLESNPEQAANSKFTQIQRIKVIGNNPKFKDLAMVSFWNPLGEDQRALLQEGFSVIITNLRTITSKTSSRSSSNISIVSSKSSRIFKDILKCEDYSPTTLKIDLDKFNSLPALKLNESFDVQGVAIGRVGSFFWIGGISNEPGVSVYLICLKNFNYSLSRGDLVNFRDLLFNHFDNREGVGHFTFTEYSDFKKDPIKISPETIKSSISRFQELTSNPEI